MDPFKPTARVATSGKRGRLTQTRRNVARMIYDPYEVSMLLPAVSPSPDTRQFLYAPPGIPVVLRLVDTSGRRARIASSGVRTVRKSRKFCFATSGD